MIETRRRRAIRKTKHALRWLLIAAAGGVLVALMVVGIAWVLS
jgi:hypothetical protein